MDILKKYKFLVSGVILGALGGFLYWNYIGCFSGHCMISSVWYNSTIYGSIMGGLIGSSFIKKEPKTTENNEPEI